MTRHPSLGRLPRVAPWLLVTLLIACGSDGDFDAPVEFDEPATTVEYEAQVEGAPNEEIIGLLEQSLRIFLRQEEGAQSLAFLRRRADGDVPTVEKILRSYGYYQPTVTTRVELVPPDPEEGADDAAAEAAVESEESEDAEAELIEAVATIVIDPGEPFQLTRHQFVLNGFAPNDPPALGPAEAYGAPINRPAVAAQILGAEAGALAAMREQGFFYAERRNRDAVADLEAATIEVESTFHTGRIHRFGPITVTGAPNVDTDYVLTYVPWGPGELATRDQMRDLQQSLLATGLFRSGTVTLPDEAPEDETAPVTITLEEGPFRSVSAGVRFNTDDGPGGRVTFEHRNLFGANERLRLTLDADLDEQRFEIGYRKPQFFKRDGQEFGAGLELRRVEDDAFDELGATLTVGVSRKLGEKWTLGGGGLLEFSDIEDNAIDTTAQLAGLPFFAEYDGSNDLLNPTTGIRWRLDLTPFVGRFNEAFTAFTVIDTRVSHYLPLDEAARYVVATRGRVGFIPSDAFDEVPQTRLLYAGGSGSVRAFAEDFVGALDDEGDPVGGRSAVEAGVELRFPIWGDLGGVAFVEGGAVADSIVPNFENTFLFGAGGGLRYFSPVGPIRLDVAVPVNGRDEDDAFQFYISIGQAF